MEKVEDVVLGGLYRANPAQVIGARNPSHDQSYGLFIAALKEGTDEVWMLDTYHLEEHSFKGDGGPDGSDIAARSNRFLARVTESNAVASEYTVREAVNKCYYSPTAKLTEANASQFELLCDLNEMKVVSDREGSDYESADVVRSVKLWWEHAYPYGVTLVRKDADKDSVRIFDALEQDFMESAKGPSCYFDIDKLRDAAKACPEYSELTLKTIEYRFAALQKMEKEWRELDRALRRIRSEGEPSALAAWEAGVPIEDIFA